MNYKDWCQHSKRILAEANKYNVFQERAQFFLLSNIGPRIAKLGRTGYMGCGFHYSLEQDFAKLVNHFSLPWQPCANWCENVEADQQKAIVYKVIYECLLRQVKKAEQTVLTVPRTP